MPAKSKASFFQTFSRLRLDPKVERRMERIVARTERRIADRVLKERKLERNAGQD